MNTFDLIKQRYSPIIFSNKGIEENLLFPLFEAARWAPSAYNEQPWRFIYCPKTENIKYEKLFNCLVDANMEWAKTAPALMLVLARKNFSHNEKPNPFYRYDTGMAVMSFIMAAMEHKIYVHQMGGFSSEMARDSFNISDDYDVISVAAIGYRGDTAVLTEELKKRANTPRLRKDISQILLT
ncbi:MAG: nitroreductase family protein [Bacteroidales bacterium]|jgi:nitroreductase|nr:nitroreductase family protein [Bacteroidales bacterium]MDD4213888.1 nitroreductase family protein [Bacteroidales bacterium]